MPFFPQNCLNKSNKLVKNQARAVIDDSRAHVAADSSSGHQRHLPPLLVIIARCINFLLNLYTLPGPQTPQFAGNINTKEPK